MNINYHDQQIQSRPIHTEPTGGLPGKAIFASKSQHLENVWQYGKRLGPHKSETPFLYALIS